MQAQTVSTPYQIPPEVRTLERLIHELVDQRLAAYGESRDEAREQIACLLELEAALVRP